MADCPVPCVLEILTFSCSTANAKRQTRFGGNNSSSSDPETYDLYSMFVFSRIAIQATVNLSITAVYIKKSEKSHIYDA